MNMAHDAFVALVGVEFTVPVRTVNEDNAHVHWTARAKRRKAQRAATALTFRSLKEKGAILAWGAWDVLLKRVSPRELDSHDGLRSALKGVADQLAEELGLPNDRDERIRFDYWQDAGPKRIPSVVVRIKQQL